MFERYNEISGEVFLPNSSSQYKFTDKYELIDRFGKIVKTSLNDDGDEVVKIDWLDGLQFKYLDEETSFL